MTAVAYRDGVMATDTGVWGCNAHVIVSYKRKIVRAPDGSLFAGCGSFFECDRIAQLIQGGLQPDGDFGTPLPDGDFAAIWARHDGIWVVGTRLRPVRCPAPFMALGTPEEFMFGALHAGASAPEAVALAIAHTDGAAGQVDTAFLALTLIEAPSFA